MGCEEGLAGGVVMTWNFQGLLKKEHVETPAGLN